MDPDSLYEIQVDFGEKVLFPFRNVISSHFFQKESLAKHFCPDLGMNPPISQTEGNSYFSPFYFETSQKILPSTRILSWCSPLVLFFALALLSCCC